MRTSRVARIMLVTMLALLWPAQATSNLAQASLTFEIRRGQYLWNVWDSPVVKQAYPDWRAFWEETSRLNNIPATETAWRRLAPGRVITLPSLEALGTGPNQVSPQREVSQPNTRILELERELIQARAQRSSAPRWLVIALVVVLCIAIGVALWATAVRREQVRTEKLVEEAREREQSTAAAVAFVKRNAIEWQLPPDMIALEGGRGSVYLLRGPVVGKDETVIVRGIPDPITIKNLKRRLDNAPSEVLRDNGIVLVRERRPVPV